VLALGLVVGYLVGRLNEELLGLGVPEAVEGTPFERTAQSIRDLDGRDRRPVEFLVHLRYRGAHRDPHRTVAGHRCVLAPRHRVHPAAVHRRARAHSGIHRRGQVGTDRQRVSAGVKLPEVSVIPKLVKYSVLYVTFIIALGQIGVHVLALLILLTVYAIGIVIVGTVAFKDFLVSSAAGIYLLFSTSPTGSATRSESATRRALFRRSTCSSPRSRTTRRSTSSRTAKSSRTASSGCEIDTVNSSIPDGYSIPKCYSSERPACQRSTPFSRLTASIFASRWVASVAVSAARDSPSVRNSPVSRLA